MLCVVKEARAESTAVSPANYCSTALTTEKGNIDYCVNVGSVVCSLNYTQTNTRAIDSYWNPLFSQK
jgi:hypothetical protein